MTKKRRKIKPNYQTRKHAQGQAVLLTYGYPETTTADRTECYRLLGVLGYLWDTRLQRWGTR